MDARIAGLTLRWAALAAALLATCASASSAAPFAFGAAPRDSAAARRARMRDTVTVLPEIRVERERALSDARRRLPTAFVTDVAADRSGARAVESLSDLLARAAGVRVTQYGGLGSFSTVSLRGAAPGQVTLYLDGVPLTSAAHGVVSLGDLPAGTVERVEVFRGLGPLGLGVATPGGAVNVVTLSRSGTRALHVGGGSFGTWEARGTAGLERGALGLLLHAGYQGSAGDYRYVDDNATSFNAADDTVRTRRNDRFDAWSGLARLAWSPRSELRLVARQELFHKAQGLPGLGAAPALSPRLAFLRSLSALDVEREGAGAVPRATLRLSADREVSRFRDTGLPDRGELGGLRHDTRDRTGADGLAVGLGWDRPEAWLALEAGASLRRETADPSDAADGRPDPPGSRRLARGAMAGVQVRAPRGRVVLHAARRWDRIEDHLRSLDGGGALAATDVARELDSPQLGARVDLGRGLEARANWARAARAPGFLELFGDQGSIAGNPGLRPESAENRDAGLAWRGRLRGVTGAIEWARFRSDARDVVVLVRNSASTLRAMNLGRARIRGDEWSARLDLPGGLALAYSGSWQSALNLGPLPAFWIGKRLPGRPSRQTLARLEWRAPGRAGLRLGGDLERIGDNVLDPYNQLRVPARRLVGAAVSMAPFAAPVRLALEGRNLLDDHAVDVGGFPLPGRSVFLGCTWEEERGAKGGRP